MSKHKHWEVLGSHSWTVNWCISDVLVDLTRTAKEDDNAEPVSESGKKTYVRKFSVDFTMTEIF